MIELSPVISDNDVHYFIFLKMAIEYSDPEATFIVKRGLKGYQINIKSGVQDFRNDIIENILYLSRILRTPITFSSSLAISNLISFSIPYE